MGNSIQDYLKKINSRLSFFDTASILLTAGFLLLCALYLAWAVSATRLPIEYREGEVATPGGGQDVRPYGSRNGATYTYSWCEGSERIKPANKIFFSSSEEAELSGRALSKLCQQQ